MEHIKEITIGKHKFKLEVKTTGAGQNPSFTLFVNDKNYHSINYFNFKKDNNSYWKAIISDLNDGSYAMFV
tara:strand:+ start:259 stop:471 length:213 start_codon:yes stop_codon:yes gene_type:complete